MIRATTILFLSFILWSGGVHADWITPSERVRDGISLRAGPSSSSAYLGQLQVGERLRYHSTVPYWYEVRLANGQPAFVSKAWSTLVPDDPPPATVGPDRKSVV